MSEAPQVDVRSQPTAVQVRCVSVDTYRYQMAEAVSSQLGIGLSASHRLLEDTYYEPVFAAIQLHGFRRFFIERLHEFTGQDPDTLRCRLEQYKWDQEKVYRDCQRDIQGLSDSVGITSEDAHCHLKASAWDIDEANKAAKVSKLCGFTGMNPPNTRLWLQQHLWDLEKTAEAVELLVKRFANDTGLSLEKCVLYLQGECWFRAERKGQIQEGSSAGAHVVDSHIVRRCSPNPRRRSVER